MVIGTWVTSQLVFNGLVNGLVVGLLAMAMVLVYRSTRIVNFAVGNMGLVGASLLPLLVLNFDVPYWPALLLCLLAGTAFGAAMELIVIRRLFHSPRVIVLMATVGIAQLAVGVGQSYPDLDEPRAAYPQPTSHVWSDVAGLRITGPQFVIVVVVPIIAIVLVWTLRRTTLGRAIEACADNPRLARLAEINPKNVSTVVWTISGLLSTVAIVLLSGQIGSSGGLDNLGALTLARAMVAFVLAGMRSFPRALVVGVLVGVVEAIVRFNFLTSPGLFDFIAFSIVVGFVFFASRRGPAEETAFAFAPKVRRPPARAQEIWWVRNLSRIMGVVVLLAAVLLPVIVTRPSRHLLYASIVCFAIAAVSLSVITGWAGQLSLSQMTFAGLGALLAASLNRGLEMDVWVIDFTAPAVPFLAAIGVASVIVAVLATVVGIGALRVRGLELAVTTFMLAIAAQQYLYDRPLLSDGNPGSVSFRRGTLFGLDLGPQRTYYYLCLVVLVVVFSVVARLRRSGIGRTTIAVRDNPDAAAAYAVRPARTKLVAFAIAGGIAALGGGLFAGLIQSIPFGEQYFLVDDSLQLVSMVVIGGLGSVTGPLIGALWVIGLPAFFPGNALVPVLTSSIGLLLILMYFPGGFAELGYSARNAVVDWAVRRLPDGDQPAASTTAMVVPVAARGADTRPRKPSGDGVVLRSEGLSVRFGGNQALDGASIAVKRGEIVGLIGTNGAGKSTFMNAVGGYVPSTGRVELGGEDVSRRSVAARAERGLGRTFQAALLFPELTVREAVQVALEARGRTPLFGTALASPGARRHERALRSEADELIDVFGLGFYGDAYISELSTGTRRIVELANLMATNADVLCLDEPTAGLAQRESEAFGPLLLALRKERDVSMLVIEHDMPLIMSITDRVYCLESGKVIAEGSPEAMAVDQRVVASYLGTDERAIARSGAVGPASP